MSSASPETPANGELDGGLDSGDVEAIDELRDIYAKLKQELARVIVGQQRVIEELAICLFARGHGLLMGVPGLAKTLLVSQLADTMHLDFNRIQFTPDLMPMDITGTEILQEVPGGKREFEFVKGPLFANVILADEINRAPAKTQAAMLEAMQERRITVMGETYNLAPPFFRARHAEPSGAGRHLSSARSATRPIHVFDRGRLPEPRGGDPDRSLYDGCIDADIGDGT